MIFLKLNKKITNYQYIYIIKTRLSISKCLFFFRFCISTHIYSLPTAKVQEIGLNTRII